MKKTYIAPVSKVFGMQCSEMLALSLNNGGSNGGGSLSSGDFGEDGNFEYNASKKDLWETEW